MSTELGAVLDIGSTAEDGNSGGDGVDVDVIGLGGGRSIRRPVSGELYLQSIV